MKLTIDDIRFSKFDYVSATATVWGRKSPFNLCSIDISIPPVEGKELGHYECEVLAKAHELITEIYKEIVCGGESDDEIIVSGKIELEKVKNTHSNQDLEERVTALEKRLEKTEAHASGLNQDSDGYLVIRNADWSVRVRMNEEKHPGEEVLVGITENCHVSGSIRSDKSE
ncbi:TPA: hypothetical protein ACIVVN_002525 [Salmonella enterica subsp. enterica serovar Kottbus]